MKNSLVAILFIFFVYPLSGQQITDKIRAKIGEIETLEQKKNQLNSELESLKFIQIRQQLDSAGLPPLLPGDELVRHSAYILAFAPEFKQARWATHIITPDIMKGVVMRTNDFRPDSLLRSLSAVEADYFTKTLKADSTFLYDGFGYDRGHIAPSADFRWSKTALSESYFYSNMTPMLPDFNRGGWLDMEDVLRNYIYRNNNTQLYIVTGPFLEKSLPVIEKGINKIPIPKRFFKIAIDLNNKRGIGFIMPHETIKGLIKSYAVNIDKVEKESGLDFFSRLPVSVQALLESDIDLKAWFPEINNLEVEALPQENLPANHFNTIIAKQFINRNEIVNVCGTVVGARVSKAGNILINLDKPFPNQVFTVFIKKEDIINFSYNPQDLLKGKIICVKGKIIDLGGTPSLYISNENDLKIQ
ncbi:MAG: DNA/RNA non-specific endonuclease [Ferruginibacter sp.]